MTTRVKMIHSGNDPPVRATVFGRPIDEVDRRLHPTQFCRTILAVICL
jgi:hypothetical protein